MSQILQMSAEAYHADPCDAPSVSSGLIHTLLTKSPYHAWCEHPKLGKQRREDSTTLDYGSACHDVLLEGAGKIVVVDAADWRTKDAKEKREAARAEGKIPVLAHQRAKLDAMVESAMRAIAEAEDFSPDDWMDGASEQTLLWLEDGVWCRARVDRMSKDRNILFDYKSTAGNANPNAWQRQIWSMGYDTQAVHYTAGNEATGGPRAIWCWLVQETEPPFACSWVSPSYQALDYAAQKRKYALRTWRECLEKGYWPGHPRKIAYVDAPNWSVSAWEDQQALEQIA